MTRRHARLLTTCAAASLLLTFFTVSACGGGQPEPGTVLDEAKAAGVGPEKLAAAADDYLKDMDGGITLGVNERKGRNTWVMWTGGNDRFWDLISATSFGALDFLKTISSYPYQPAEKYPRQRAVLPEGDGPRPEAFRLVAGSAGSGVPTGSVRG
jgi:hypothetical protein